MKEKLKTYLWRFLDWAMPKVIETRINQRVYHATVTATMRVMDAQKLSHCNWCAQRFGLRAVNKEAAKAERILACPKHYKLYGQANLVRGNA